MQGDDLGGRDRLKPGMHLWWYPAETNVTLLANGQWFWARSKQPRPVTQLVEIFYASIGRNGNLLLNLSPDNRGLVPDDQVAALGQMAEIVDKTFATNLAGGARVTTDTAAPGRRATAANDGKLDTWWEAAQGQIGGTVKIAFGQAKIGKPLADRSGVQGSAFVTGARQGKLARRQARRIGGPAFDQGQRLQHLAG